MNRSSYSFLHFASEIRKHPAALLLALAIVTALVYGGVMHHDFLQYDDAPYVTSNANVRSGLTAGSIRWAFTTFEQSNWHPLTWLSHMADCQFFGLNSGAHHLVSVFFHLLNALLLLWLLYKGTGALWRSFFVALLFAIHPMNVETVAWIAERKSLLSTLFSLLAIAAYGYYVRQPKLKNYLLIALAFLLALLSKPMAVSLPLVLLFLDYWPLQRLESLPPAQRWLRLTVEKIPLFLMSAASCAVTVVAQHSGGSLGSLSEIALSLRLENAVVSYADYLSKLFWPVHQSIFYPFPEQALPLPQVILSVVAMAAISAAVWHLRRNRYLVMGWSLFVVTLIPVIGVVQVGSQAMADRYVYIPYIGLFILLAWGATAVAEAIQLPRLALVVAGTLAILLLSTATVRYLRCWQDEWTLFSHAREVVPQPNTVIEQGLADAALHAGKGSEAYRHAAEACSLAPHFAACHYVMAQVLLDRKQLREALAEYEQAATYTTERGMALASLTYSAAIAIEMGDRDEAEYVLASALKLDPSNPQLLQLRQAFERWGGQP